MSDVKEVVQETVVTMKMLEEHRNLRAYKFFIERWKSISDLIPFSGDWEYPYHHGVVPTSWPPIDTIQLRGIPPGKIFRATHSSGERILFVGTRLGPVAVYMATTPHGDVGIYQYASDSLSCSGFMNMSTRQLDVQSIRHILGTGPEITDRLRVKNIGEKIEAVYNHFTNPEKHSLQSLAWN